MTGAVVVGWTAWTCLLAAAVLGARGLAAAVAGGRAPTAGATRLAGAYNRSRRGRRMSVALADAMVDCTPWQWRLGQVAVTLPAVLAAVIVTGSPLAGLSLGTGAIRAGSWTLLRVRHNRRARALVAAAPGVARSLAVELAAGAGWSQAVLAAAEVTSVAGGDAVASLVLARAAAAVAAGSAPDEALDLAARAAGAVDACHPLRQIASAVGLQRLEGDGGHRLHRLAQSLEEAQRARLDALAVMSEVRVAAAAVPILTLAVAVSLLATDQARLVVLTTTPGLPLAAALAVIAALGTLLVRRLAGAGAAA